MTLVPNKIAYDGKKVDSSPGELEKSLLGGFAEVIVWSLFCKSRIKIEVLPKKDKLVDFRITGKTNRWNVEVKTTPSASIRFQEVEEKPELLQPGSKIIHINRTRSPFIRVATHQFRPGARSRLYFWSPLWKEEEFDFDLDVYKYYEERARLLVVAARLVNIPEKMDAFEKLALGVAEKPIKPYGNTPRP